MFNIIIKIHRKILFYQLVQNGNLKIGTDTGGITSDFSSLPKHLSLLRMKTISVSLLKELDTTLKFYGNNQNETKQKNCFISSNTYLHK